MEGRFKTFRVLSGDFRVLGADEAQEPQPASPIATAAIKMLEILREE